MATSQDNLIFAGCDDYSSVADLHTEGTFLLSQALHDGWVSKDYSDRLVLDSVESTILLHGILSKQLNVIFARSSPAGTGSSKHAPECKLKNFVQDCQDGCHEQGRNAVGERI
eukprot:m.1436567 g.1436567  ORF g.1436567 m.1436567 type:complete len:113 (-) comp25083_c0_seq29:7855-8193(-)